MAKILEFDNKKKPQPVMQNLTLTVPEPNEMSASPLLGMCLMSYPNKHVQVIEASFYDDETQYAEYTFTAVPDTVYILTVEGVPVSLYPRPEKFDLNRPTDQ